MVGWLLMLGLLFSGNPVPLWGPALQPVSAGDPVTAARQEAMRWLHTQQLADGSFGPHVPGGQSAGDAGSTADVVYILALSGEDPGGSSWTVGGQSALDALARLAPDYVKVDAGQAGKVARAVAAAGRDARAFAGLDLVKIIEASYDPATGRYLPQLLFRHTLALEGLVRSGAEVPPGALDALWQARLPDGGWFWAFDAQQSDLDTTGRVMQILATFGGARCAPALLAAVNYVAGHEDRSGGWGASNPAGPPNANSTGMAVAGLSMNGYDVASTAGRFAASAKSPIEALLAFQEPTGAFAYMRQPGREEIRLAATIDALTALAPRQTSGPACNLQYLPVMIAG